MTALFNFQSALLVLLLFICTAAYCHQLFPAFMDRKKDSYVSHTYVYTRIVRTDTLQACCRSRLEVREDWGTAESIHKCMLCNICCSFVHRRIRNVMLGLAFWYMDGKGIRDQESCLIRSTNAITLYRHIRRKSENTELPPYDINHDGKGIRNQGSSSTRSTIVFTLEGSSKTQNFYHTISIKPLNPAFWLTKRLRYTRPKIQIHYSCRLVLALSLSPQISLLSCSTAFIAFATSSSFATTSSTPSLTLWKYRSLASLLFLANKMSASVSSSILLPIECAVPAGIPLLPGLPLALGTVLPNVSNALLPSLPSANALPPTDLLPLSVLSMASSASLLAQACASSICAALKPSKALLCSAPKTCVPLTAFNSTSSSVVCISAQSASVLSACFLPSDICCWRGSAERGNAGTEAASEGPSRLDLPGRRWERWRMRGAREGLREGFREEGFGDCTAVTPGRDT